MLLVGLLPRSVGGACPLVGHLGCSARMAFSKMFGRRSSGPSTVVDTIDGWHTWRSAFGSGDHIAACVSRRADWQRLFAASSSLCRGCRLRTSRPLGPASVMVEARHFRAGWLYRDALRPSWRGRGSCFLRDAVAAETSLVGGSGRLPSCHGGRVRLRVVGRGFLFAVSGDHLPSAAGLGQAVGGVFALSQVP